MTFDDLRSKWGTDSNIARALGVSRQLVGHWRRNGIPYARQCIIQLDTKGRLRAESQRADSTEAAA